MRLALSALMALTLAGAAIAQTAPRITIEDDVAHLNSVKCAGLRAAQMTQSAAPDALLRATHDAWMASMRQAGHDAGKIQQEVDAEAALLASSSAEAMTTMARGCTPFEIRAAG